MKHIISSLIFLFSLTAHVSGQNVYKYTIDLKNVKNDKVKITLECPEIKEESAIFVMPRVIPGSYAWKDFGRFVSGIKAYDASGTLIKLKKKENLFYIYNNASKVKRLEYWIDDTWDDKRSTNFVFQPGGSNIEENENFVINHHAFEGYFEGYKNLPFEVEIIKPEKFYGSTYLKIENLNAERDLIKAKNFFELSDNPVMYCVPDTSTFYVGKTKINISVYSKNDLIRSYQISEWLQPLAISLRNFLGAIPADEYNFIFYFTTRDRLPEVNGKRLGGFGALEHHHCSFYFLPELGLEDAREMVQDVGAHEFLHTLTPLNLHSHEISDFNFKDPKMSRHLWLYEGVTEYLSWLVRVQNDLVTEEEFLKEMRQKLTRSDKFGLFSFTEMSSNVLEKEYKEKYSNVYQKGAILAMQLDQLLLKKSEGKYGIKHLVKDLMQKYGPDNPFEDEKLFEEIVSLTFPSVGDYIKKYIEGSEKLPTEQYMSWFGYRYQAEQRISCYYIANFSFRLNEKNELEVGKVQGGNINLLPGDKIIAINQEKVSRSNFDEFIDKFLKYNPSPSALTFTIIRNGKEKNLTGIPIQGTGTKKHVLVNQSNIDAESARLREAWLRGNYQ